MKKPKIEIVRRKDFFDVYSYDNGERVDCGSGSWSLVQTAISFYTLEGYEVKVYENFNNRI